jgi:two-component system, chemotaxis family, protein-glutamate methylesterase/glutaminase
VFITKMKKSSNPKSNGARRNGATHDLIVVGASAGGVDAFQKLLGELPCDLPAAVLLVIHTSPQSPYMLPTILSRVGTLRTVEKVTNGQAIRPGHLYVAPPDMHLMVEDGHLRLVRGPKENRHRPAIDPLFRSAARAYGPQVIGTLLTGNLDDGSAGLMAVKACGGITVVQDPLDALYPEMPRNALTQQNPDYCLPLRGIGPLLKDLVMERANARRDGHVPERVERETEIAEMTGPMNDMEGLGKPSTLTCPECNGTLWEIKDRKMLRFRCHVGHAFSGESLDAGQAEELEAALWSAVRSLEEREMLLRRLAQNARRQKHDLTAAEFEKRCREIAPAAKIIRSILLKPASGPAKVHPDGAERKTQLLPKPRRRNLVAHHRGGR